MTRSAIIALGMILALGACTSRLDDQSSLYNQLRDQDVRLAASTLQRSLKQGWNGETLSWRNAATGATGSITPTRTILTSDGSYCRDYDESIVVGGRSGRWRNTACRDERGNWIWV